MSRQRRSVNFCVAESGNYRSEKVVRNWFTRSKIEHTHSTDEELLKSLDCELSSKNAARVREHLETCWDCRLQLEKLQETISAFVEFRQQIQTPVSQEPPRKWSGFDSKLKKFEESDPVSIKAL